VLDVSDTGGSTLNYAAVKTLFMLLPELASLHYRHSTKQAVEKS
jgi:hypothetical protein